MICPKCEFDQPDHHYECLRCGVIFAKLEGKASAPPVSFVSMDDDWEEPRSVLKELLLPVDQDPNPLALFGRAVLLAVLTIWGCHFIFASIESNTVGKSFLHLVNLPFHEAGHLIFSPFGKFVSTLGGSLFQLIMPAVCMGVLLIKTRDPFGAAAAQWWLGESFMDIAPYINDARALKLTLLGGITGKDAVDYHDWEYLLRKTGLLQLDHALAYLAQGTGILLMLCALTWMAMNVWMQFKTYRKGSQFKRA
jgi:rubredoxin